MSILMCSGKNWMKNWDRIGTKHVKIQPEFRSKKQVTSDQSGGQCSYMTCQEGKGGYFYPPFCRKEGISTPLFCLMYDNNANFEKYNLWIMFLKSEASHSTLCNLDLSAYPSSEKEG